MELHEANTQSPHRAKRRETYNMYLKLNLKTEERACLSLLPQVEINEN